MDIEDGVIGALFLAGIVLGITVAIGAKGCVMHGEEQTTERCKAVVEKATDVRLIEEVCGDGY